MAERSTWKGSIGFGMVNIPVKLYTATDEQNVSFNQLHRTCGGRITMPRWCEACGTKVETAEIVKGYPIAKDEWVHMEEDELKSLPVNSSQNIEVMALVDESAIDPRFPLKSYFLAPDKAGVKAFSLFMKAMGNVGKVAIAKLSMRERERMVTIRPFGGLMLVQTLWWADELKDSAGMECVLPEVSDKEMGLAVQLLRTLAVEFNFGDHKDEYREALMGIIQAKVAGETVTIQPKVEKKEELDLMEALTASLSGAPVAPPEEVKAEVKAEVKVEKKIPTLQDRIAALNKK